ncbi:MAG: hypothetical protein O9294_15775 [Cytophagales bacterium]|jgi:hypothetical protein|nr:hypothetical protein [Cytophagales bacterium]
MNHIKKLAKGLTGLLLIFFLLFNTNYLLTSCADENYYETNPKIDRASQRNDFVNVFKAIGENHSAKYPKPTTGRNRYQTELEYIVDAIGGEEELLNIIDQVQPSSLNLIRSYGITDAEILAEFGSLTNPAINEAAMMITETDNLLAHGYTLDFLDDQDYLSSLYSSFGTVAYADPTVGGCIGEAAGITILTQALQGGIKSLGKKGALKILSKVASRYLGWVGAAVMVIEFSECMGWTDFY